jgi:uncharacterized short protein YbdD (DUF466 family)
MKKFFQLLRDYINGDFAYKKYVEHHQKTHPQQNPLDKKSFLRDRQRCKWKKINRCC